MPETQAAARAFAQALDHDDFDSAERMLAINCVYSLRGNEINGRAAIIKSYRAASAWASANFDQIRYESSITPESSSPSAPAFRVRFLDLTTHQGISHRHQCEQVLTLNAKGEIVRIQHIDLPGERERLDAYLARIGVQRRE